MFAQTSVSFDRERSAVAKPKVFLDSIPVELEHIYFDTHKIKNIDVKKVTPTGVIFITSKNPDNYNFLSYATIKARYFSNINKPILLLINGEFINDLTKVNIDSSYIFKIEVERGEDFKELKNLYPDFAIVNIKLNNINNTVGERQITLHGMRNAVLPE